MKALFSLVDISRVLVKVKHYTSLYRVQFPALDLLLLANYLFSSSGLIRTLDLWTSKWPIFQIINNAATCIPAIM